MPTTTGSARERKRELTQQLVVRVNDDLLRRLEADAASHGRTVAQTVRFRLANHPDLAQAAS
ncbi:MAG: hypothetical protein ACKV2O_11130 [Acidimicrobiales bacterium]